MENPMEKLRAVITANREQQQKEKQLNVRAGEIKFPILSKTDWLSRLTSLLGGAVSAATIPNIESLRLAPTDQKVVDEILRQNPDTVKVLNGEPEAPVSYSQDGSGRFFAKVAVTKEQVDQMLIGEPKLPSGRVCIMVVTYEGQTFESDSLAVLIPKLEARRIEAAWSKARSEHESRDYTKDTGKLAEMFAKVGTTVEVIQTVLGDAILGWFYLSSYYTYGAQLKLAGSKEEAEKKTAESLPQLFQTLTSTLLQVPDEAPFKEKDRWGDWILADPGRALQAKLAEIGKLSDLTVANFITKVNEVKDQVEKAKAEIGGRFIQVKSVVDEFVAKAKAAVSEISYSDEYLVAAEIKALKGKYEQAEADFKAGRLDEAEGAQAEVELMIANLAETLKARLEAKGEAEEAQAQVGDSLYEIRYYRGDLALSSESEATEAGQIADALNTALSNCRFDEVVAYAAEGKLLVKRVEARLEVVKASRAVVERHIAELYATTDFGEFQDPRPDQDLFVQDDHELFIPLKEAAEQVYVGDDKLKILESRLNGQVVSWIEVNRYDRELYLTIRVTHDLPLVTEADLPNIEVIKLWHPPQGEELEVRKELRQLNSELESWEFEERCIGRVKLRFQPEQGRNAGKLFATDEVSGLYLRYSRTSEDGEAYTGPVRYCVDPARCSYLDHKGLGRPKNNETWLCTFDDFAFHISDGVPYVGVRPQAKEPDFYTVTARIRDLETRLAELTQTATPAQKAPAEAGTEQANDAEADLVETESGIYQGSFRISGSERRRERRDRGERRERRRS